MQMKRPSGFLAGLERTSKPQMKPKRRKIDPEKLTHKDVWQSRRKKGRLVIRNLPFKITDETLKEHFEKYGEVIDVKLLRRKDGKLVGCGFVEFENRENAKTALEECSGKPLMNRPIIIDWAVPKDVFKGTQRAEIKEESEDEDFKEKPVDSDEDEKPSTNVKDEGSESDNEEDGSDKESDEDGSEEIMEEGGDSEGEEQMSDDEEEAKRKRLADLDEGKTVFLKCVPFSATEDDLRECLEKFGPMVYALICVDRVTEHSKGTAFVKFRSKESADKCLEAGASDLRVGTGVLDPHRALDKRQLQKKFDDKKSEEGKKDNRNLYLIKEGVILAGSAAAKGVTPADMAYRLQLEQSKSQILRNLSMVISPVRIAIHNLPENYTDQALRNMLKNNAPADAKITETRIMRDLKKVDAKGVGLSKGYGFASFTQHAHALATLRATNNNPNIFSPKQRPIVSFSIENKAVLNARQKRMEMSRVKNPTYQNDNRHAKFGKVNTRVERGSYERPTHTGEGFVGIEAHRSQTIKFPTRGTLKAQASLHRKSLMDEKKKVKKIKQGEKQKKDRKKKQQEPRSKKKKQHIPKDAEEKAFDVMVNKYKGMVSNKDIKKWYE